MSLIALPFSVDINKVKSVFGCKDRALLEQIKTANLYDNYASQDDDFPDPRYRYNFDQALEDILFRYTRPEDRKLFMGSGLNKNIPHAYGYVMLVICDALGTHLLPHCDGFYAGDTFDEAEAILKKQGLKLALGDMFEGHDIFDIPKNNDFPGMKLYTKQEMEHVNQILDQVDIDENAADPDNDEFDEVQEMLQNLRYCFRTTREQGLDLITFAH